MCFGLVPGKQAKANISLDTPNESGRGGLSGGLGFSEERSMDITVSDFD